MAAGRIKGITIEIGGDTTKLTKALSAVDNSIRNTQTNINDLNRALKLDPGNTELLRDRQQELARQIEDTKAKIDTEREALEQMRNSDGFDETSRQAQNLKTQIDIDTAALKELEKQAKDSASVLGTQMQLAGEKISAVGDKIKSAGDKIAGLGQTMTTHITVPVATAFGASIKEAIDWESAFTGVMKTVDETANTTYDDLKDAINEIAKTTASTQNDIAATMEIAGQLGVSADDITEFTRTMVMLGDTTNLSSEEAASAIAKFANVTNMSLGDVDKLGSVIVDLGNNYATTEADIMSMATRLSGAGAQIGLSQGEILGFATALSSVGIEAEMGGSAFSKAMIKMQVAAETGFDQVIDLENQTGMSLRELELLSANSSKDFKALADSLGLTSTEMNATIKAGKNLQDFAEVASMSTEEFVELYRTDAPAALQAFISGLGDTESHGESTITMLQEMGFTEVRLRDTLTRLAQSGDLVTDAVSKGNEAWVENEAMTAEAEKRYATMEAQISQLKARITEVAVSIGEMLMPYLQKAMDFIEGLIEKWNGLSEAEQEQILKIAGIAAAIGPVLLVGGKLISGIGTVVSLFGNITSGVGSLMTSISGLTGASGIGGLSSMLGALASPVGIAVAALAALAGGFVYLYQTNDEFAAHVNEKWEEIKNKLSEVWENLKPTFDKIGETFANLMQTLEPLFTLFFDTVISKIEMTLDVLEPAIETLGNVFAYAMDIFGAIIALLTGDFDGALEHVKSAMGHFADAWGSIMETAKAAVKAFLMQFGLDSDEAGQKLNAFGEKVKNGWTNLKTDTVQKWNAIKQFLADVINNFKTTTIQGFEMMKQGISTRVNNIRDSIKMGFGNAVDFIKSLPEKALQWGKDLIQNFVDGIKNKISAVSDIISVVADLIARFIHFSEPDEGPLKDFHLFAPDMVKMFAQGITQSLPVLERATDQMASVIASDAVPTVQNGSGMASKTVNAPISIVVNGAPGQDVNQLADIIQQRMNRAVINQKAVFA